MKTGKIKWYNPEKGFGFIVPDEGGPDVFIHKTALEKAGVKSVKEGQAISFEIVENRGKKSAGNIKLG